MSCLFPLLCDVVESTGARVQGESHFGSLTNLTAPAGMRNPEEMLRYEKGRAEAFGALCSIFSSQDCGEPFQPIYLAKFYHALILGLHYTPEVVWPGLGLAPNLTYWYLLLSGGGTLYRLSGSALIGLVILVSE